MNYSNMHVWEYHARTRSNQGFFIRPFGPNRLRPVPANRSGLTGYR